MAISPINRALQVAFLLSATCLAQSSSTQNPPPPPCPTPAPSSSSSTPNQDQNAKPCTPAAKRPTAAQQFPFPGDSKPKNPPPDSPSPTSTPDSPHPTTPSDAATQHPFPTQPPPKLPDDNSSSSSSSSSGDDLSPPPTDDPNATGDPPEGTSVHRKLPKVKRVQTDDERVDEDISVANFYMRDENYPGAYLRAKDAVSVQPEYSVAHFTLAEAAQKMKKNEEAIAEFQTYLKLDPNGEKAKAAQKALAELQQTKNGKSN